jgi:SAM-dependent methyltransferase
MSWVPLYDALAADYDRFVAWKGRLSHELPFFVDLFEKHNLTKVLDTACGTGHHAIALAERGYQMAGADLSSAMVERARENAAAAGVDIQFSASGFGELASLGETFDAVICLGNSLPHLLDRASVQHALTDFAAILRPGGLLLVQNRNFDQVWATKSRFMSPQSHRDSAGEWLFVRFYDFHEETITFNMIRLRRVNGEWTQTVESTELRPIFRDDLATGLDTAGFTEVEFLGGYDRSAFDPDRSGDLVAVALKPEVS